MKGTAIGMFLLVVDEDWVNRDKGKRNGKSQRKRDSELHEAFC